MGENFNSPSGTKLCPKWPEAARSKGNSHVNRGGLITDSKIFVEAEKLQKSEMWAELHETSTNEKSERTIEQATGDLA